MRGSPELLIQMLDKLVDNATDFSRDGDTIGIELGRDAGRLRIAVRNPGPPLPERMRTQHFDSMVSVRGNDGSRHMGLGLYVARLIAEGLGGSISADNIVGGVQFVVLLPEPDERSETCRTRDTTSLSRSSATRRATCTVQLRR
jgi:signal transduction histidine kinase